jgi:hypothetical protein
MTLIRFREKSKMVLMPSRRFFVGGVISCALPLLSPQTSKIILHYLLAIISLSSPKVFSMSYRVQPHTEVLLPLSQATARDLRTLQIKFTYVGSQPKPLPSVVFTSFYHLARMEWFLPLRSSNLHYANDDIALWNFTVTPEEIHSVVTVLAGMPILQASREATEPYLSLMLAIRDSRLGEIATEVVLNRTNAELLMAAVFNALDKGNGVGRMVIKLQQQQLFA